MSMRTRLVLLVITLTTSLLGALGVVLGSSLRGWTSETIDAELERRADVLTHEAHLEHGRLELDDDDDLATRGLPFRIESSTGALLLGSERWPAASLGGLGFTTTESRAGEPVRVLSKTFTPRHSREALVLRVAAPIKAYAGLADRFRTRLLLALLFAALSSALGAALLSRWFLGPLQRLSREVEQIEARSLSQRLDPRGLDPELSKLAVAFNELLGRVASVMEGQREFIGRASHALRTPLASILTQAEVALRRERSEASYRETLASIAAATRDAAQLSDGLLALTRADAQASSPKEDVSVGELARELERLFRPRAEQAGLRLEVKVPDALVVHATRARLREVLDALLDNAVRYTPEGGVVSFVARAEGPRVALEVLDTGPGIPVDEREKVFERFYRGAAAATSGQPGSGLGLAVVQALVAAEGGAVSLGEAPGGGTRVTLVL